MSTPGPAVADETAALTSADAGHAGQAEHRRSRNPVTWLLTALVDLYRLTAPVRQPRCRFHPSCSTYARQALVAHGPLRGLYLTVRRLLRCHPWNPGGVDHVPAPRPTRSPRSPRSPKA